MAFYFAQVQEHFGQVEQRLAALDSRLLAVEANCLALTAARQVASRNEAALEERVVERVSRATNELALRVMRAERFAASRIGEPNEPVASIVDLATTFGAEIVLLDGEHGDWPARLATDPDAACLEELALPPPGPGAPTGADEMRAFRIACP